MGKYKKPKIDNNIYVIRNDYTYKISDNSNASIKKAAMDDKTVGIVFPIHGIHGTKYFFERNPYILMDDLKVSVEANATFMLYNSDFANLANSFEISIKSKGIAEYYDMMGSLYNLQICTELLEPVSMSSEICVVLSGFIVRIDIGGEIYELTPEKYRQVVPLDEYDIMNSLEGIYITLSDLIDYIEHTVCGKPRHVNVTDKYKSFMLYPDGTYAKLKCNDTKSLLIKSPHLSKDKEAMMKRNKSSVVLLDSDCSLYVAVPYDEYDMIRSDSSYNLAWAIFYDEINTQLNSIADKDLSVDILYELDGVDYDVNFSDECHYTAINQAIFSMVSMADINMILMNSYGAIFDMDRFCYTWAFSKNYDKTHAFSINESTTSNLIERDHVDMLGQITKRVHSYLVGGKLNGFGES